MPESGLTTSYSGYSDQIRQFVSNAQGASATVEVIPALAGRLKDALQEAAGPESPVLMARPEILSRELFDPFIASREVVFDPDDRLLESTQVGITEGFAGVIRTGSVCILVGENLSGSISLFPRKHIAVLEAARLTDRPRDLFDAPDFSELALTRDFVFVTGPSATADMGPLVQGVHGPGELHIILMERSGEE